MKQEMKLDYIEDGVPVVDKHLLQLKKGKHLIFFNINIYNDAS